MLAWLEKKYLGHMCSSYNVGQKHESPFAVFKKKKKFQYHVHCHILAQRKLVCLQMYITAFNRNC